MSPENHSETEKAPESVNYPQAYAEVCTSYRAVDDIRIKLLGFLPVASAGGVILVVRTDTSAPSELFVPAGIFGFLVTLGLFAYEIFGIKRCHELINAGKSLEGKMGLEHLGQFSLRPPMVAGFIAEPFAAGVIYPAVLASWLYVALVEVVDDTSIAIRVAIGTFLLGLVVVLAYAHKLQV